MTISNSLRAFTSLGLPLVAVVMSACATTTPVELITARTAYEHANASPAAQYTPSDLHKAKVALDKAEQSFANGNDNQVTADLAYVAERMSQTAEALAAGAIAEKKTSDAKQAFGDQQGAMVKKAKGDLVKTREELAASERGQAEQAQQAGVDRSARQEADQKAAASEQRAVASDQKALDADKKTQEANDALAKLAAKDEERGMVITLSGNVLFRSNDSTLLPGAQTRLDEVAAALVAKAHPVVVEGYTDSRGSQAKNVDLSQRRAESVRSYLVSRGVPGEMISAKGMGPDRPVAENTSAEGRANNRRVEIVVAKNDVKSN